MDGKKVWKTVGPALGTLLLVVIGLWVYSKITKNVEVDAEGKALTGGKVYKTKFSLKRAA